MSKRYEKAPRAEYPICPRCGCPCAGAMMTSRSYIGPFDGELYYHPDAVSLYCTSGDCNYDHLLAEFPSPAPPAEDGEYITMEIEPGSQAEALGDMFRHAGPVEVLGEREPGQPLREAPADGSVALYQMQIEDDGTIVPGGEK